MKQELFIRVRMLEEILAYGINWWRISGDAEIRSYASQFQRKSTGSSFSWRLNQKMKQALMR